MKGRDGVNSREQEISEISRGLKQLAKELTRPVIALSPAQPRGRDAHDEGQAAAALATCASRAPSSRTPTTIIFIYRDEYYNPETTEREGHRRAHHRQAAKRPDGQGAHPLHRAYTRFDNLAAGDYPETRGRVSRAARFGPIRAHLLRYGPRRAGARLRSVARSCTRLGPNRTTRRVTPAVARGALVATAG